MKYQLRELLKYTKIEFVKILRFEQNRKPFKKIENHWSKTQDKWIFKFVNLSKWVMLKKSEGRDNKIFKAMWKFEKKSMQHGF